VKAIAMNDLTKALALVAEFEELSLAERLTYIAE
jgi:hypothetical protein